MPNLHTGTTRPSPPCHAPRDVPDARTERPSAGTSEEEDMAHSEDRRDARSEWEMLPAGAR